MLSNREEKYIRSLHQGKYREKKKAFIAEGEKTVMDLIREGWIPEYLLGLTAELDEIAPELPLNTRRLLRGIDEAQLKKISTLKTPNKILAVFPIPEDMHAEETLPKGLILYLDGIRDPGNMGTILRIADWFGIAQVIASPDSVDVFNPKVVQSTMGSIARVSFRVYNYEELKKLSRGRIIYGSSMEGKNIYHAETTSDAILVIGNEAQGIRTELQELINKWIAIPSYESPGQKGKAESLNAAIATAVLCAEFKRRTMD